MNANFISDSEAMVIIHEIMDGEEWSSDTLEAIANIVRQAGYEIRDCNEMGD